MEEQTKTAGGDLETQVSDSNSGDQTKDQVSYDSYRKLLGEKKRRDDELRDAQARLKALEEQELERSGKHEELNKTLKQQLMETEKKLKEKEAKYAWNMVSSQIKQEASRLGCANPDKLLKLLDKDDLNTLEVRDDFSVNRDDLARLLDKAKQDNDFLFRQNIPHVKDSVPSNKVEKFDPMEELKKLTPEQMVRRLQQMEKNQLL